MQVHPSLKVLLGLEFSIHPKPQRHTVWAPAVVYHGSFPKRGPPEDARETWALSGSYVGSLPGIMQVFI